MLLRVWLVAVVPGEDKLDDMTFKLSADKGIEGDA